FFSSASAPSSGGWRASMRRVSSVISAVRRCVASSNCSARSCASSANSAIGGLRLDGLLEPHQLAHDAVGDADPAGAGDGLGVALDQHRAKHLLAEAPAAEPVGVERLETDRSEEHTSELQSRENLVCRLLL